MGFAVDILDLSRLVSEYGRQIHPCKSCVSTAMPLCHWPCSCYPNYSLGQTDDWMNDIYPLWVAAHGILIVAPVNWYHASTALKAMIDRLVCADGGNPDPTSTHGKHADQAKALELKGWPYPRHLAGRYFGLVIHGDSELKYGRGRERVLSGLKRVSKPGRRIYAGKDRRQRVLGGMGIAIMSTSRGVITSRTAEAEGYVGYMEPYATSHQALDEDREFQEETINVARALGNAVKLARAGKFENPAAGLADPNPK